jgi:hypothetical protein
VVKVDLRTFQQVGVLTLGSDEGQLRSAVIDPAGNFAYFGASSRVPSKVVKIRLDTFERVGAITLAASEGSLNSAVIDPPATSPTSLRKFTRRALAAASSRSGWTPSSGSVRSSFQRARRISNPP